MATPEHNQIADPRLAPLPRRHFIASLGAAAAAIAAPAAAIASAPAPLWPAPHDTDTFRAILETGLTLKSAEEAREGATDPNGDSETEVFTINALYGALEHMPRYHRSVGMYFGPNFIAAAAADETIGGPGATENGIRGLCAEYFRAGQLSAAKMLGR